MENKGFGGHVISEMNFYYLFFCTSVETGNGFSAKSEERFILFLALAEQKHKLQLLGTNDPGPMRWVAALRGIGELAVPARCPASRDTSVH